METKVSLFEPLLEKAEQYSTDTFELLKLKSIDKAADLASSMASRLLLIIAISLFMLTLNIAVALWIGDSLGKNYYGFLIVAAFYLLIAIIIYIVHPRIKTNMQNSIIKQILN